MLSVASASITAVVVVAATAYVRRWRRSAIGAWRAGCFLFGLLFIWAAAASPMATLDDRMLTAHMAQHLLLMTLAPPLIWLGEPVKVWRRGGARWKAPRKLGRVLGHPAFCWLAAAVTLTVWHVPAALRLGMESTAWHVVEHASFLAAGLLFWWPVVQPWPGVARWPRWSMLLYLFGATLPCDVLAGLLVFSDRVAYPMYLCTPRHSGLSVLEDQQCAAALMWTCVTVVFLVAGTILATQLLSPDGRSQQETVLV
ncbi:MAG: cytochrome c oxidase assembly protein [Bryobacteraceae bacterium]